MRKCSLRNGSTDVAASEGDKEDWSTKVDVLSKITYFLNRVLMGVAGGILAFMIFLTCANVFLRIVSVPIKGNFELMGYFGAIITAFALGYTQIRKGHISVDVLVLGFSERTQRLLSTLNNLICMLFFGIVGWRIARYATTLMKTGEVAETLGIPYYPFIYAVSFGFIVLSLVCLMECIKGLLPERKYKK